MPVRVDSDQAMSLSNSCLPSNSGIIDDLLTLILVRLPVKSLLPCKAVSKPWYSLISSPGFIRSHYTRAITSPGADETLMVRNSKDHSFSLVRLGPTQLVTELKFPFSQGDFPEFYGIFIGSAKGIACVSVSSDDPFYCGPYQSDIYLWNPAIKQSKVIPPIKRSPADTTGFGYDPIADDFKVVVIFCYPRPAEVYSSNMNVWRKLGCKRRDVIIGEFSVCVDRFLCWNGGMGVVAFDLNREDFNCDVKFPNGLSNHGNEYLRVTDFNYSVAVIKEGRIDGKIKLWKLDNVECLRGGGGGGVASWTLVLSINVADLPLPHVHSYFNNGYYLLNSGLGAWFLYNSDNKELKKLPISEPFFPGRLFKFTESLVSIPGFRPVKWNAHDDHN